MRFKIDPNGEYERACECRSCVSGEYQIVIRKREPNPMPELKPGMAVRLFPSTWRIVSEVGEDYYRYWYRENEDVSTPNAFNGILAIKDCDGRLIWERDK